MMSYIDLINGFERVCESEALPGTSQLLWYKLVYICNRRGWPEWVCVDNMRLMSVVGMRDEKTLIRSRNKLIDAGLFEYRPGKKGSPGKYRILIDRFTGKLPVNMPVETPVNMPVETPVNMPVETPVNMPVETPDIIRHKTKNKTKENDACASQKKFVPPSVDEVRAYCAEKGYGIDAGYFVDVYQAKGWMIGSEQMRDWKAVVRCWVKRDAQNAGNKATPARAQKPVSRERNPGMQKDYTPSDIDELEKRLLERARKR